MAEASAVGKGPQQSSTSDPSVPPLQDTHDQFSPKQPPVHNVSTEELEKDLRNGERWLIGIGIATVIINTTIAFIYWGQLREMREATKSARLSADAADKSAKTADATLKEMQAGSNDTHDLAISAAKQADAARKQSAQAEAQARTMTDSLVETRRLITATYSLSSEAKRSADLAQQSFTATQQALRLDQRAWVSADHFELMAEPEEGKDVMATVTMVNTGKTPAIDVHEYTDIYIWEGEPPENSLVERGQPKSLAIIPPGSTKISFKTPLGLKLNSTQLAKYADHSLSLYVKSIIRYKDVFAQPHRTNICVFHEQGKPLDFWSYCEHGNDADGPDMK